jgi:hypothetical protein
MLLSFREIVICTQNLIATSCQLPAANLTCSSVFMFQNASAPPYSKTEFYFFNLWAPTHVHQFDAATMSLKADAFLKHASQCEELAVAAARVRHATSCSRYPDPAFVSKVLQFIGVNTPHYAQQLPFAEGYQYFS